MVNLSKTYFSFGFQFQRPIRINIAFWINEVNIANTNTVNINWLKNTALFNYSFKKIAQQNQIYMQKYIISYECGYNVLQKHLSETISCYHSFNLFLYSESPKAIPNQNPNQKLESASIKASNLITSNWSLVAGSSAIHIYMWVPTYVRMLCSTQNNIACESVCEAVGICCG